MSDLQGGSAQEDLQIVRLVLLIHIKIIHLFIHLYMKIIDLFISRYFIYKFYTQLNLFLRFFLLFLGSLAYISWNNWFALTSLRKFLRNAIVTWKIPRKQRWHLAIPTFLLTYLLTYLLSVIFTIIYMLLYAHNVLGYVSHNRISGYSLWKIVIYVSLKGFIIIIIITINININIVIVIIIINQISF